jgi:hypothetical protein
MDFEKFGNLSEIRNAFEFTIFEFNNEVMPTRNLKNECYSKYSEKYNSYRFDKMYSNIYLECLNE